MADDRQAAQIEVFPARTDNIGVLIHDPATGATAAVDAPEAAAVLAALTRTGWTLTDILVTHKHADHIDGIPELKRRFPGVRVVAPLAEKDDIPLVDVTVSDGDTVKVGELEARVIATPGHTAGHVAYWFARDEALFAGDTLFSLGCGRLFEGSPGDMWGALQVLRNLPDAARLYCGHDYTLSNARFALSLDGDNAALRAYAASAEQTRADGRLTIPARLGDEKALNPFLRADDPAIARAVGLDGADAVSVFAELRERKNRS